MNSSDPSRCVGLVPRTGTDRTLHDLGLVPHPSRNDGTGLSIRPIRPVPGGCVEHTPGTDRGTDESSPRDRTELLIVLTVEDAEQIVDAARAEGNAADVIDALSILIDRATKRANR